jgi:hypothetical protein
MTKIIKFSNTNVENIDIENEIKEEKIKMNSVFEELKNLPHLKKDKKFNNSTLITKINKSGKTLNSLIIPKNNNSGANTPNSLSENKIDNKSPIWGLMLTMQENLNGRIGGQKWKRYIRASFWNNISTPINFTITLFTALSAGQTGTQSSYLSNNQLFYILFFSFILSTINTFFKLKDKAKNSRELLTNFEPYGSAYEDIYFQQILNNEDVKNRLKKYQKLQKELNEFLTEEKENYKIDYISDFLFIIIKYCCCCCNNTFKLINFNERYWVLDGISNIRTKSENIDMNKLFLYDFTASDNNV